MYIVGIFFVLSPCVFFVDVPAKLFVRTDSLEAWGLRMNAKTRHHGVL